MKGEGEPVMVMVHGNPTWSFLLPRILVEALSGQYSRDRALDQIGCGLSEKPGRLEDMRGRPRSRAGSMTSKLCC